MINPDEMADAHYPVPTTGFERDIELAKNERARARTLARAVAEACHKDAETQVIQMREEKFDPCDPRNVDGGVALTVIASRLNGFADSMRSRT